MPNPTKSSASSIVKNLAKEGNSKFVGPRRLNSLNAAEEAKINRATNDVLLAVDDSEVRAFNREARKSRVRTQSSLDSLSSLMRLIKKLPDKSQKSIIEQLKAARKKPGGSPDAAFEDLDLPF